MTSPSSRPISPSGTSSASTHISPQHPPLNASVAAERPRLIRMSEVQARCGLGKSMIYGLISKGEFPSQVRCGPKAVTWIAAEVDAWVDARIAESKGGAA